MSYTLEPIGKIELRGDEAVLRLDKKFIPALTAIDGFEYIKVLWWFDRCDNEECRSVLELDKPYKKGPDKIGVFATRGPQRPNPIAISNSYVTYIDRENGVIGLAYIDAAGGSPVLDIKPYSPSEDVIKDAGVPEWCAHWPRDYASSGEFDWEKEFNF